MLHFTNNQKISIGDLIEDLKIYIDVLISIILWLFYLSQIINLKTAKSMKNLTKNKASTSYFIQVLKESNSDIDSNSESSENEKEETKNQIIIDYLRSPGTNKRPSIFQRRKSKCPRIPSENVKINWKLEAVSDSNVEKQRSPVLNLK